MRPLVELALFKNDVPALAAFYEQLLGGQPVFQSEQMALFQLEGLHILIHHRNRPILLMNCMQLGRPTRITLPSV